jgi:maltoporin
MMKMSRIALAAAMCAASCGASALTVDFSGYMRAGTGVNLRGGTQVCFGLGGADSKWRLGNECDYVIEPNFDAKLAEYEGSTWNVHVMPSVYRAWGQKEDFAGAGTGTDELVARFGQIYTYGTKISALGNGTVWAGKRFFHRLQTGINDQFLENHDGDGAGVEDIELGVGKLSVGFMMNGRGDANNNRFALPVRLSDVKTLPNGTLSVFVTPEAQLKSTDQSTGTTPAQQAKSLSVGVYQTVGGTLGGDTLVGFKHERITKDDSKTRLVVQQTGAIGLSTRFDLLGEYRVAKSAAGNSSWFGVGARTDTHISGPFRVIAEVGNDRVKPDGASAQSMTKFSVAGAVSAGKDPWSRPTIRVFLTHAIWNEAARKELNTNWVNGQRLQQVYGDQKSGTSVGIQAETWW